MDKSTKVKIGIGLGLASLVTLVIFYMKRRGDAETPPDGSPAPAPTFIEKISAAVGIKKPGFATSPPPSSTPGAGKPMGSAARKIGDKAFAANMGANAYKTATISATNIYKHYNQGQYIGTHLAVEGAMTKLTVEETGIFSNSFKQVYVPTKDLTY